MIKLTVPVVYIYSMKTMTGRKTLHKKTGVRPTTGKVRESLFNILRGKVENSRFLDLYAGTGAVGIDALREGAADVVFVEESRTNSKRLTEVIQRMGFSERARIITKKVISFIGHSEMQGEAFDIIFLDPPYHSDEITLALGALGASSIIVPGGMVIAEHFAKRPLQDCFGRLAKVKDYVYGDSVLTLYEAR